jgi:hypothetical protein
MLRIPRGFYGGVTALSLSLLALSIPALASLPPGPGAVNYVEGQVSINGKPITSKNVGSVQLGQNQVLTTDIGKAEVLLAPGTVVRVGYHSELHMISAGLSDTRIELVRGEAMVEVTDPHPSESLRILNHGASVKLVKNGLYSFSADTPRVSVYEGKAVVVAGDKSVTLGKGRQTFLATDTLRSAHFDRNTGDLYMWSKARDGYLAQAGQSWVSYYGGTPGYWNGAGWYWNPYYSGYAFVPGSFLYSPFGYGFYSPFGFYGGYYGGFYGGGRVITRGGFGVAGFHGGGFRR